MSTELEIAMPDEVPVMTLPRVAFFPQALLPLPILEPRYRCMLAEIGTLRVQKKLQGGLGDDDIGAN